MQFMIYCRDKPDHAAVRSANRTAHLAHLDGFASNLILAGPLLTDDGTGMIGSLLIMEFPDRAAAEKFSAGDPYRQAGLFDSVTIMPWRKTLPR